MKKAMLFIVILLMGCYKNNQNQPSFQIEFRTIFPLKADKVKEGRIILLEVTKTVCHNQDTIAKAGDWATAHIEFDNTSEHKAKIVADSIFLSNAKPSPLNGSAIWIYNIETSTKSIIYEMPAYY